MLNNDNDESREVLESCYRHKKTLLNPIINWSDEDVWEFIHREKIPYCCLYDEGEKRVGCIGCPQSGSRTQKSDFERYPKYKDNYLKAFGKMIAERKRNGMPCDWETADEVMEWWLSDRSGIDKPLDGQLEIRL